MNTPLDPALNKRLQQQDDLIRDLNSQVNTLMRTRRGGGFPWFPLLLVGGAVYLYRSNPTVRDQIDGLLDRVNPGIKGNLTRAGDAAKDAVQSVMQGDSPKGAAQDAAGELKRAGEKAVDQAKDKVQDVKDDAQRAADRARDDRRNT